jgi:glycine/D-amino acid oxidase-like deaminating enzyme
MSRSLRPASVPPPSLWAGTAEEPVEGLTSDAPLDAGAAVDLAIVGGGYTGLSTALHAAEAGLSAQVIEAGEIGQGGSGRNAGLVNAGVWYPPAKVREKLGPTYGPRFVARFGAGPEMVFALIERHQIRCEATREGTLHAAHAPSGLADLKARHAEWRRLGAPVDLLDREQMAAATGTRAFFGGLRDRRAGTVNPMGYARGLARAALAAGASITTGAPALSLRREPEAWIVETAKGALRARAVVLATNAYTDGLWPGLSRVFTPISYFQLATEPLGPRAAAILPGGQGLWDTAPIMTSLRRDRAGRIVIGSMGEIIGGPERGLSQRWAARRLARLFPDLGPVRFEAAWDGRIAMTPDHLPRICHLADGLYTPIGYNGRGITSGTIFGAAMAALLTGAGADDLPLPVTGPQPVRAPGLRAGALRAAFAASQVWRAL